MSDPQIEKFIELLDDYRNSNIALRDFTATAPLPEATAAVAAMDRITETLAAQRSLAVSLDHDGVRFRGRTWDISMAPLRRETEIAKAAAAVATAQFELALETASFA